MPDQPGVQSRRLAALDALQKQGKGVKADPSALRLYIRDNFASMLAARERGVSWQQIADVMVDAGVRAPDGSDLTWRKVAVLFHAERQGKGRKKTRTMARKPAPPPPTGPPSPSPPRPPEPPEPKAAGAPFSTGDPALDRALNSVRTLTPLPARDLVDGWRGRTKPTKESKDDGEND